MIIAEVNIYNLTLALKYLVKCYFSMLICSFNMMNRRDHCISVIYTPIAYLRDE